MEDNTQEWRVPTYMFFLQGRYTCEYADIKAAISSICMVMCEERQWNAK